jgi:hypothetical protein
MRQENNLKTEIIVVDNASADGTPDLIRKEFPHICLKMNASNDGFARANNVGMLISQGKYISLINSDVWVPPNCLDRLVRFMEENPLIGIVGPKMIGGDGKAKRSCMRFPTLWSVFCRALAVDTLFKKSKLFNGYMMRGFEHDRLMDVDVLNGWFWVVRREALELVGLLDEQFFMYGEDVDWCYRFRKAGWRVVFYPGAEAMHYGGGSSEKAAARFYVEKQRANAQCWMKHKRRSSLWIYLAIVWLHELLRTLGYLSAYIFARSSRSNSKHKIYRSLACLSSLAGGQYFVVGRQNDFKNGIQSSDTLS